MFSEITNVPPERSVIGPIMNIDTVVDKEYVGHTFRALAERTSRFAAVLRGLAVAPGDRVALFMYNTPDYLPLMWGAWWAGVAVVPINAKLHAKEAAFICTHSGSQRAKSGTSLASWPRSWAT